MSAREIIQELEKLSPEDLREVQRHLVELTAQSAKGPDAGLRLVEKDGRLLLTGDRVILQSEVEAILADFP